MHDGNLVFHCSRSGLTKQGSGSGSQQALLPTVNKQLHLSGSNAHSHSFLVIGLTTPIEDQPKRGPTIYMAAASGGGGNSLGFHKKSSPQHCACFFQLWLVVLAATQACWTTVYSNQQTGDTVLSTAVKVKSTLTYPTKNWNFKQENKKKRGGRSTDVAHSSSTRKAHMKLLGRHVTPRPDQILIQKAPSPHPPKLPVNDPVIRPHIPVDSTGGQVSGSLHFCHRLKSSSVIHDCMGLDLQMARLSAFQTQQWLYLLLVSKSNNICLMDTEATCYSCCTETRETILINGMIQNLTSQQKMHPVGEVSAK